jgi:hypothetical protein
MGERKLFACNDIEELLPTVTKPRREVIAAGIKCLLSTMVSGNKSGARKLTSFGLTHRRGDERFTCATKARMTSGGRFHPENGWLAPVADRRLGEATGRAEAL